MLDYLESDFCQPEDGMDYVFGRMSAIYGAAFMRHWEGVDVSLVRDTWLEMLGVFLTYRPKLDYALKHMDPKFPPSVLSFKELCNDGPQIPPKPAPLIEHQPKTPEQIAKAQRDKEEALGKLREWSQKLKNRQQVMKSN